MVFDDLEAIQELELEILKKLIPASTFPKSLVTCSYVKSHFRNLAQDHSLWREALQLYFPGIIRGPSLSAHATPLAAFKFFHHHCWSILNAKGLTMETFYQIVSGHARIEVVDKSYVFKGLLIAAGIREIDPLEPDTKVNGYAFIFCACLGNTRKMLQIYAQGQVQSRFLTRALHVAAATKHVETLRLIMEASARFIDVNDLRNCFIKIVELGLIKAMPVFLQEPILRKIVFSLKRALILAIDNDYLNIATLLLHQVRLEDYRCLLREAVLRCANLGKNPMLTLLLSACKHQLNDSTQVSLVKVGAQKGNELLIHLFLEDHVVKAAPSLIIDTLQLCLIHDHENIAQIVLRKYHQMIRPYLLRQWFLAWLENGFDDTVVMMVRANYLKPDPAFYGKALLLAAKKDKPDLVSLFLSSWDGHIANSDREAIKNLPGFVHMMDVQAPQLGNPDETDGEFQGILTRMANLQITPQYLIHGQASSMLTQEDAANEIPRNATSETISEHCKL